MNRMGKITIFYLFSILLIVFRQKDNVVLKKIKKSSLKIWKHQKYSAIFASHLRETVETNSKMTSKPVWSQQI